MERVGSCQIANNDTEQFPCVIEKYHTKIIINYQEFFYE